MKNFSGITDNLDITTKKYVDDGLAEKANSSDLATVATSGSYNDLSNKPTIPDVSGLMPKSGGTFTGEVKFGSTENFQGYYIKRMIGSLSAGTTYANLDSSYKDGTWHRMWRLRFPSGSNFWGKIKITLYGGYSSFNASGVMSKSITCNFNTSSIYNNVGCYDGLGVNVEQDFRISEAIWNSTESAWEVLIWQKNLSGNNSPVIMLECWTTNNTNYINAFNGIAKQPVELTQSTSYSAQKASPTGGTKTVEWATLPVYENPLGEEIATVAMLEDKQDKITSSNKLSSSLVDGLGAAAAKAVDTAITANSTSTNLPTSKAVEDRINAHCGIDKVGTITGINMNGASKGTSGVVDLGTVITAHQDISGKLDKTTYEVNKTINFGSSGVLYVGKFKVYDTNVTCEITSTTSVTYSGKLVIATQNNVIQQMTVYGDAANTVAPNFFIKPSTTSDPYIEVYFKPAGWSKNVVHIYGSAIEAEPTNVCTNVSAVPSTATSKPTNALNSKANLSGGNTFSGAQRFKDSIEFVDSNGDGVLSLGNNAIFVDPEDRGLIPVSFSGSFGLSGQVLTSQGHNTTPIWEYVTKHGYIELTNEDLNTILTPGWYRAPRNHSCKNIPISSPNEFILIVESSSSKYIQQTFYVLGILSECHIRYTNNGGTSWGGAGWYTYRLINTAGSKTGQVLTSTGIGAPEWKSMPTYSLSGTELTITLP